ncbi:hypothetical protein [Kribbella sp. NPDC051770]|uniref:hypothetical protein n=1 Tax=Kribbella sp. NPDC051770 TaxID=3155413 RepID=UPI003441CB98
MVDQTGAARLSTDAVTSAADVRTALDQAAADGSITQARYRAVDPVPIVTDGPGVATLDSTDQRPLGVRRRLSPRPVPGNRRKRPPAQVADEEPTPAEEMDDVGTHDDKAAKAADAEQAKPGADPGSSGSSGTGDSGTGGADAGGSGVTATKTKPQTAAEIVAAQKAREAEAAAKAAAPKADDTAATSVITRQTGASGNKPGENPLAAARKARESSSSSSASGKGRAAMSTVGSGVKRLRNLIASLVWLLAVLAAAVLALGALFTALDQANQSNEIVRWVLERGHDLVGPFKDLFRLETAKNTLLVNWGIAALVYLIVGKIIERFVRP